MLSFVLCFLSCLCQVLFKLDLRGNCHVIKGEDLNKTLALDHYKFEYFRHFCILAGCDYLDSIPGIGIKRSHTFMKKVSQLQMETSEVINQPNAFVGCSCKPHECIALLYFVIYFYFIVIFFFFCKMCYRLSHQLEK